MRARNEQTTGAKINDKPTKAPNCKERNKGRDTNDYHGHTLGLVIGHKVMAYMQPQGHGILYRILSDADISSKEHQTLGGTLAQHHLPLPGRNILLFDYGLQQIDQ